MHTIPEVVKRSRGFISRQKHNYRVGMGRAAANSFLTGLTSSYNAIYAVGLGADTVSITARGGPPMIG